jgi:hypothetical protein
VSSSAVRHHPVLESEGAAVDGEPDLRNPRLSAGRAIAFLAGSPEAERHLGAVVHAARLVEERGL